jgi:hypothetical protein
MAPGGTMTTTTSSGPLQFASLSAARKRLVETLRKLQFGRIEYLYISRGEPEWKPGPTIIQTIKLPVDSGAIDPVVDDCMLKKPLVDLFRCFDRQQSGVVRRLECRFGLPCLVEIIENFETEHGPDRSST